jgi:hypothetical protein
MVMVKSLGSSEGKTKVDRIIKEFLKKLEFRIVDRVTG